MGPLIGGVDGRSGRTPGVHSMGRRGEIDAINQTVLRCMRAPEVAAEVAAHRSRAIDRCIELAQNASPDVRNATQSAWERAAIGPMRQIYERNLVSPEHRGQSVPRCGKAKLKQRSVSPDAMFCRDRRNARRGIRFQTGVDMHEGITKAGRGCRLAYLVDAPSQRPVSDSVSHAAISEEGCIPAGPGTRLRAGLRMQRMKGAKNEAGQRWQNGARHIVELGHLQQSKREVEAKLRQFCSKHPTRASRPGRNRRMACWALMPHPARTQRWVAVFDFDAGPCHLRGADRPVFHRPWIGAGTPIAGACIRQLIQTRDLRTMRNCHRSGPVHEKATRLPLLTLQSGFSIAAVSCVHRGASFVPSERGSMMDTNGDEQCDGGISDFPRQVLAKS
ncbi:hypothetical protein JB92DRAFT_3096886 [Gautieria morchelliformis]|nr:hypothetical protein JB92DRAFT_3096886 [Gautieria morchelliformis]